MTVAVDMCHFTCTVASFQFCHFAGEESWYFMTPPWLPPKIMSEGVFTRENSHRHESHTGMTFWFRIAFTWWLGHFISRYLKVHFMLIKYTCDSKSQPPTHPLPVPVYRQTDFTPKRLVVSSLHDTTARFRTGVKFSPWFKNRSELTPGWLAPAWHFVVVSCKQI